MYIFIFTFEILILWMYVKPNMCRCDYKMWYWFDSLRPVISQSNNSHFISFVRFFTIFDNNWNNVQEYRQYITSWYCERKHSKKTQRACEVGCSPKKYYDGPVSYPDIIWGKMVISKIKSILSEFLCIGYNLMFYII